MTSPSISINDIEFILDERQKQYGNYTDVASTSQALKEVICVGENYFELPFYAKESLDMIASKVARIVNGDWKHKDSWKDIAGYAQLVLDILED